MAVSGTMAGNQSIAGAHAPNWEAAASRPSETNCTTADRRSLPAGESTWTGYWWKQKNAIVDRFIDERPNRANRPVSVRSDVKIREECTREKHADAKGTRRSAPWSSVLNDFINWYNDYRHLHLRFKDPDGKVVRGQMPNSHQPRYRNRYYAKIKAFERQAVEQFDDLHVVMLTLTGSMRNEKGGWRCPADHLRDVLGSWRPTRGRGVYHALRDSLDRRGVDRWEYATVVEHHANGYGHAHVALFVDGEVDVEDFRPAVDAHVRECEIAGADAHQVTGDDGVVSVNRVDTGLEPEDYDGADDVVGNLGSYVAEYIGASADDELLDRSIAELTHRAACWATGTQMVRFSTGANELIREDRGDDRDGGDGLDPVQKVKDSFDADADDPGATVDYGAPTEVVGESGWSLEGVASVDKDGESVFDTGRSSVNWVNVDDATHLDPPKKQPVPLRCYHSTD